MSFLRKSKPNLNDCCYAPAGNLYFKVDGKVSCCSSGASNVVGIYPIQTLNEIVNGLNRQNLIRDFRNGIIPSGCKDCYQNIQNNNKKASRFQIYNKFSCNINRIVSAEFELSNHCNLKCIMCSSYFSDQHAINSGEVNQSVYDQNFISELKAYIPGIKTLNFKGGEPFLIDLYYDIWESVNTINPQIVNSVTTNGTILNNRVKEALSKGRFNINVSIDSLEKENYEKIRKNASFEVFSKNLRYFIDYCKLHGTSFTSCSCIMSNNYHDIPAIFEFANRNNFSVYMNYVEQPEQLSIKYLNKNDIVDIIGYLKKQMPKFRFFSDRQNRSSYSAMITQLELWANQSHLSCIESAETCSKETDVTVMQEMS